jgi:carboxymethylenebutenolidase
MRTYVYQPKHKIAPHQEKKYGGVILYSAIFQHTPPVQRTATFLAGHGYVVMVPEIYHSDLPAGTVLGTDTEGKTKGNDLKKLTPMSTFDNDCEVLVQALKAHPACNGRVGSIGFCIGGHLAFRAALNPNVVASASFYPTDVHSGTLGTEPADTINRLNDIKGELIVVVGRQDPHVPKDGRMKLFTALQNSTANYSFHEVNGDHSFMTDEDPSGRYAPALTDLCFKIVFDLFQRNL